MTNVETESCTDRPIVSGLTRRDALRSLPLGFGTTALTGLLQQDGLLAAESRTVNRPHGLSPVRSVVFFFTGGGPGQVDTFDPKPLLQRLGGQKVPDSIASEIPRIARAPLENLLPSYWKFRKYGDSGIEVSDLFAKLAGRHADDLCVIRSMKHDSPIHAPAEFLTMTGTLAGDRPSLGAWLTYGLGSDNSDLPGFVLFRSGSTLRPPSFSSGFLPARYQGVLVDIERGVPHTALPTGVSAAQRSAQLDLISRLNRRHLERHSESSDLEARIRSYEMTGRMQMAAPEAFDLSRETLETQQLYGVGGAETDSYGRILLQTRRLIERGVRFIMVRSGGWDFHKEIATKQPEKCRATDQPLAALLTDLKRRGLLEETLIVWGGEFGRTPTAQGSGTQVGRDHSPSGYSMWLSGGGVRGGQVIGATDPVGYAAIERPVHPNDLHATILTALGVDQHQLFYEQHNRREIVTVNGGRVVNEVFTAV